MKKDSHIIKKDLYKSADSDEKLVKVCKILNNFDKISYNNSFVLDKDTMTRHNSMKSKGRTFNTNRRIFFSFFFTGKVIEYWT